MFFYTVRRILATLPVMAVVALFVFSLLYLSPGDPAEIIAGDQARPEDVQRVRFTPRNHRPLNIQEDD
jgi:peptide/nickel transport system permease protein